MKTTTKKKKISKLEAIAIAKMISAGVGCSSGKQPIGWSQKSPALQYDT